MRADGEEKRHGGDPRHRGEIALHIVGDGLQAWLDQHIGLVEQQGMTVGAGLGDQAAGQGTGRTGAIVDVDGNTQAGAQALGQQARHRIGDATGGNGAIRRIGRAG